MWPIFTYFLLARNVNLGKKLVKFVTQTDGLLAQRVCELGTSLTKLLRFRHRKLQKVIIIARAELASLNMECFTTCHKQDLGIFFCSFRLLPVRSNLRAILKMAILCFCWQILTSRTLLIHPNQNNSKIPFSFVCNAFVEMSSLLIEFSSAQHLFYSDYCAY